jgi:hypothetical protein
MFREFDLLPSSGEEWWLELRLIKELKSVDSPHMKTDADPAPKTPFSFRISDVEQSPEIQ